jgi:hypothetical protein
MHPSVWEDNEENRNVIFTFEEHELADGNLLSCVVQEIDDISIEDWNI